jgi:hypothetical protein
VDEAVKKTTFENHLKEDWKTVHNIYPNIGGKSGTMVVAANVVNSTTTPASVTGMAFTVAASKTYGFKFVIQANSSAGQSAIDYQFTGPGGTTSFSFAFGHAQVGGVWEVEQVTALSTKTNAANQDTGIDYNFIEGMLVNGANAGTVQLQVSAEDASNDCTVHRGSWGTWYLLD